VTCVEGNFGVGSSRDNEASTLTGGSPEREPRRRLPAARWSGARSAGHRVNSGEVPLKTVKFVEPKLLSGSGQKGTWSSSGAQRSPDADVVPPVERHDPSPADSGTEHRNAVVLRYCSRGAGTHAARCADGAAAVG